MRYRNIQDGEWVMPRMKNHFMKCCDCGLVHRIDFKVIKHARGAIVGVVDLDACYPAPQKYLTFPDRELGNFTTGRFAWLAENARLFEKPIPWKGRQGFFNVEIPDQLLAA
jgi:hypothetical protein